MLIDVVPVVRELVPGLLRQQRPSVAYVRTTHPKYLVFDGDAQQPACVVEIGDEARLRRIHAIQIALHGLCPAHVARPLACAAWAPGLAIHIQQGVPGVPWFRLFETLTSREMWERLLDRVTVTMNSFHAAIAGERTWVGSVRPAAALAEQLRMWCVADGASAQRLIGPVTRTIDELGDGTSLPAIAQHGDYSLNNLVIAPDAIAVIDLEEFGLTRMPLHDAVGLGLSFSTSQDGRCPIGIRECVERCIGGPIAVASFDAPLLRALILHHLLWRINQSHGHPARTGVRAMLTTLAEAVASDAGNGLDALAVQT